MTDAELIRTALVELLIKVNHFDDAQARAVHKARTDDSVEQLIAMIRERLEIDKQIADTLADMPESLRAKI